MSNLQKSNGSTTEKLNVDAGINAKKSSRFILLSNYEFDFLFDKGDFGLIAFFATLRGAKRQEVIRPKRNQGLYRTIQENTGLSLNTIRKYFEVLEQLNLVDVHNNGNVCIRGRRWTFKNLPPKKNKKLIPIEVCEKFADTKLSAAFVLVHSNLKKQKNPQKKSAERIKLLTEEKTGRVRTLKDHKRAQRIMDLGITLPKLLSNYRSNGTLSNEGFARLITKSGDKVTKSKGNYFKNKLLERGLITQQRMVTLISPGQHSQASIDALNESKPFGQYGGFFLGKNGVYFESSPIIELVNGNGG